MNKIGQRKEIEDPGAVNISIHETDVKSNAYSPVGSFDSAKLFLLHLLRLCNTSVMISQRPPQQRCCNADGDSGSSDTVRHPRSALHSSTHPRLLTSPTTASTNTYPLPRPQQLQQQPLPKQPQHLPTTSPATAPAKTYQPTSRLTSTPAGHLARNIPSNMPPTSPTITPATCHPTRLQQPHQHPQQRQHRHTNHLARNSLGQSKKEAARRGYGKDKEFAEVRRFVR